MKNSSQDMDIKLKMIKDNSPSVYEVNIKMLT